MSTWVEEPDGAGTTITPALRPGDRNLGMRAADPVHMQKAGMGRIVVVLNARDPENSAEVREEHLGLKDNEKVMYLDWREPVVNWTQFHALAEAYIAVLASVKSELGGLFWSPGYVYQDVVLEPLNDPDPKIRFGNHVLALALATVSCAYSGKAPPGWARFVERAVDQALDMGWMMPATMLTHDFIKSVGRPSKDLPASGSEERWRMVLQQKEQQLFLRVHEQQCTCGGLCFDIDARSLLEVCMPENYVFDTTGEGGAFADAVGGTWRANLSELDKHAVASRLYLLYVCEPFRRYMMEAAQRNLDKKAKAASSKVVVAKGKAVFGAIGAFLGGLFPAAYELLSKAKGRDDFLLVPLLAVIRSARSTYESRRRLYRQADREYKEAMAEIERGRRLVSREIEVPAAAALGLPSPGGGEEAADDAPSQEVLNFMKESHQHLAVVANLADKPLANEDARVLTYEDLPEEMLKEWAQGFRQCYRDQIAARRGIGFWKDYLAALPPVEVAPTYPRFTPSANMFNYWSEVHVGVDKTKGGIRAHVSSKSVAAALRRHYWDKRLWGMPSEHFEKIQLVRKCLGPVGLDCSDVPSVYGFRRWDNKDHPNAAVVMSAQALQEVLGYNVIGPDIGVHQNSLQLTRIGVLAGENYSWLAVSDDGAVSELRTMSSGMPAITGDNTFRCIL